MNIDGKPKLYTRNGKPIVSEVISGEIVGAIPEGYVLDGELDGLEYYAYLLAAPAGRRLRMEYGGLCLHPG